MKTYLVRLKPLDYFFFGSERGYRNYSQNDSFAGKDDLTYYLCSRKFPQQTSLLGMLRQEILVQERIIKSDRSQYESNDISRMKKLIGEASFNMDDCDKKQNFGSINDISPILLYKNKEGKKEFIMSAPLDHKVSSEKISSEKYCPFKLEEQPDLKLRANLEYFQPFKVEKDTDNEKKKEYNPKNGLVDGLMNLNAAMVISNDKVFIPFEKVGNNLNLKEDGFYKQIYYTLAKENSSEYEFAFFLKTDYSFKKSIVHLGKDKSTFQIIFEETKKDFDQIISESKLYQDHNKIILVSDCYLPQKIDGISFAIRKGVSFRNLRGLQRMSRIPQKYNFWERGSVIYVKKGQKDVVLKKIRAYKNLYQIGYNHGF
ncbi:MAG: hypothetical protein KAX49_06680 [Halanaerobiales bacterium]|nr:hypothetical protein [Halanaerobiales bacterium]